MGLADLYGHWKKHGLPEPVISEEYDPDRVKITVYTDSGQYPTNTRPIGPRVPQVRPKVGPSMTRNRPKINLELAQEKMAYFQIAQ